MDKLDRKLLIGETGSSVPPSQGGTLLDPKLTALLEFLRLLYDRKRELFSKVIIKHRKKVVEHLKQMELADELELVQVPLLKKRSLSVGSTRGMLVADDLKMERFKKKISAEPQSYSGPPSPPRLSLPPYEKPRAMPIYLMEPNCMDPILRSPYFLEANCIDPTSRPHSPPRPRPAGLIKNKSLSAGPPAPNGGGGKGGKETKSGGSKYSILSCLGVG